MAWAGSSVAVDDDVYLYYAGYRWGHKYRHSVDRQFGLVKVLRDRYVARQAGEQVGVLTTRTLTLDAQAMALNVAAQGGRGASPGDHGGRRTDPRIPVPGLPSDRH